VPHNGARKHATSNRADAVPPGVRAIRFGDPNARYSTCPLQRRKHRAGDVSGPLAEQDPIAETQGAAAGLAALDALSDDARLADYQPYWAARAVLLARIGETPDAIRAYERAIGLERDPVVRRFLQQRSAVLQN
jgi:hypothetical protein